MVEHQREKQYMVTMLEDLQTDTATIQRVHGRALSQIASLDSLVELGNAGPVKEEDIILLYLLKGRTNRFLNIRLEDRTASQLKNAGGMRLIRKASVSNVIRQYWDQEEIIYRVRDRLEMAGENINDVASRIFYDKFLIPGKDPLDPPTGIKPGAVYINNDSKLMAEYINRVASKLLRTRVYIAELDSALGLANQATELIKKEYHLR